ncbi:MAG: hypothetical protein WC735_03595 [Candidatus Paceibacterota bacterium]|jgi:hypothetical protein
MTEKLKQAIEEEIAKLPKEGQDAIGAVNWIKITEEIGKKFLLENDEIEDFQLETLLVLIGSVDSEFYSVNIENQVGTTKEEAKNMADEAFQKIFVPIRNILEENIKKDMKNKNPDWKQSLDFILSGGDYLSFITPTQTNSPLEEYPLGGGGISTPSGKPATPQEGNDQETVIPVFSIKK